MPTKYDYFTALQPLEACSVSAQACSNALSSCASSAASSAQHVDEHIETHKAVPTAEKLTIFLVQRETPPMPECIMQNEKNGGHYTTVKWSDNTYTTVKASDNDEGERSVYMAFCAALAKKLYGSNSAVHRMVNRHTTEYLAEQKKKADAEKRAKEREAEQAAHERALLREAKRLRLREEAKAYNRAHRMDEE